MRFSPAWGHDVTNIAKKKAQSKCRDFASETDDFLWIIYTILVDVLSGNDVYTLLLNMAIEIGNK